MVGLPSNQLYFPCTLEGVVLLPDNHRGLANTNLPGRVSQERDDALEERPFSERKKHRPDQSFRGAVFRNREMSESHPDLCLARIAPADRSNRRCTRVCPAVGRYRRK